jgi:hypothetical protein
MSNYTIEVGSGKFADDCTIECMSYGMQIELRGINPRDIHELLTIEEVADDFDLSKGMKLLVAKHGLSEVLSVLEDCSSAEAIAKELYDINSDAVIQCVADHLSE